ncbi:MAG: MATE family efflux transporter [Eubacterium sp.]|nr:MATE family efflux transporter [Eubacterium sp.]
MKQRYGSQFEKMTKTPVEKLVLMLGLPTTISMMVTTFYSMADTYFVGKLGTSATGAIGIVFPLMGIIQALGFMLGHGCGSNISRLLGAKETEKASDYASTAFFVSLFTGVVLALFGSFFVEPLMRLLGSSETILPFARTYGIFIVCGIPAMMSSFVMNNILRYEGRASLAMIGLVLGGLLNVFGDWLTISGLGMGIEGVGISTMLSNYVSMSLLLSMFLQKKTVTRLQIRRLFTNRNLRLQHSADGNDASATMQRNEESTPHRIGNIIVTGLPSLARQGMSAAATMSMNWMAGPFGDAAIAAMSVVMRISFMLYAVGLGIGQGFQPVCGFNYGAGLYARVRRAAYFTWVFATGLMVVLAVSGWFIADDLVALFRRDPEVISIGGPALQYQLLSLFLVPVSFIGNMLFQSIGKNGRALFLSCLRNGLCYIPALFILVPAFGLFGIQIAQPVADVLTAMITLPFFISFLQKLTVNAKK